MNVLAAPRAGFPLWAVRRASWFLAVPVTASAALPVVAAIGDLDHSFPARAAHDVALDTELDGAVALLEAGGVEVHTRLELPTLAGPVNALFAWAVRGATTNILRHSHAQRCWVTGRADTGRLRLEVVNDGVTTPGRSDPSTGSGLTGLAARAGELAGHVRREHHRRRFRLTVEVPAAPQEVT
ncbi:MAG: hypothetical protein ACRDT4_06105 [Micromonosporaceae bacterium]